MWAVTALPHVQLVGHMQQEAATPVQPCPAVSVSGVALPWLDGRLWPPGIQQLQRNMKQSGTPVRRPGRSGAVSAHCIASTHLS